MAVLNYNCCLIWLLTHSNTTRLLSSLIENGLEILMGKEKMLEISICSHVERPTKGKIIVLGMFILSSGHLQVLAMLRFSFNDG